MQDRSAPLNSGGVFLFLLATAGFTLTLVAGPQTRYSPEDIPGMVVTLPTVFGVMATGALFYMAGARIAKNKEMKHPCQCFDYHNHLRCPVCNHACHCDSGLRVLVKTTR